MRCSINWVVCFDKCAPCVVFQVVCVKTRRVNCVDRTLTAHAVVSVCAMTATSKQANKIALREW